jgi:hypothetical protein
VSIQIQSNQATCQKLTAIFFENFANCQPNDFRCGAFDPALDDTRKSGSPKSEETCKIEILRNDHCLVITSVLEDYLVKLTNFSNVLPMGNAQIRGFEILNPTGRQVLVDDQIHEASS